MKIGRLKVNHLDFPLGYEMENPVFSWVVLESTGKEQAQARLQVALDDRLQTVIYDSGINDWPDSRGTAPGLVLEPRTRYFWTIEVWADDGDYGSSETAWFETGKMTEAWQAQWIAAPFAKSVHPYFHTEFTAAEEIAAARVYICGLGLYELEINGKKAGDEFLMPGYYDYHNWLQCQTYDVTDLIRPGMNGLGVILGNGWYKGRFGFTAGQDRLYGDQMQLLCELHIKTRGGKSYVIASGKDWLCHPSPILESSIYDGEIYDAGREMKGWSESGLNVTKWQPAVLSDIPRGKLGGRFSPRLRKHEVFSPVMLIHTPAGETVLDFGQEITGWMEFPCGQPAGKQIRLWYGEILQKGNFYQDNLRLAKAEYQYYASGNEAWVRPHFTYYGFRYVKVEGLSEEEMLTSRACVIHSDLESTGRVKTSDEKINRLFLNALWGQKGNFLDVPTDCPQRDERMGWTGDAQVFAATATFNMDTAAFYRKYLHDMLLEQQRLNGAVPDVVPNAIGRVYEMNQVEKRTSGACAWADAATIIPWTMYLFYGDKEMLGQQFDNMRLWVDWIKAADDSEHNSKRLWNWGFHYGDWLALDHPDKESRFGGTDNDYIASCYYYYSASLTAKAAAALGKEKEQEYYGTLADEIKQAVLEEFFTTAGDLKVITQTACVLSLYLDLVPPGADSRKRIAALLKKKLDEKNGHLDTGFVGTPWLCPVLSENGLNDYAYQLLFNEDYPSWLYEVNLGATTIWERWNSVLPDGSISGTAMNSLNHYAYGAIAEWMYRFIGGINPVPEMPGFKKVILRPMPDARLSWAEVCYQSPMGEYRSRWEWNKKGNGYEINYQLTVPFGAQAEFVLPEGYEYVLLNGGRQDILPNTGKILLPAGQYCIAAGQRK